MQGRPRPDLTHVSVWRADDVENLGCQTWPSFPYIDRDAAVPAFPDLYVWDSWPLQYPTGATVTFGGVEYWFMLSSPRRGDPGKRHDHARIRLVTYKQGIWADCGDAMPDGYAPGSREWAGSAVLEADCKVSLYFTAAGRRDHAQSFEQRLFLGHATLDAVDPDQPKLSQWTKPEEIVCADGAVYMRANQSEGVPGAIKAFRDPAFFQDPADGEKYLLFTGSAGWSADPYNGVIGIAGYSAQSGWQLMPPLVRADGLNNEMERPHIVYRNGQYYLFWSTQRRTFKPSGPSGPNGLYAMVARSMEGPWEPVNSHGLVAGNPDAEPLQAYSWWVTGEGEVIAFIDHWGLEGRRFEDHPELNEMQFGGTPTRRYALKFDGKHVTLVT